MSRRRKTNKAPHHRNRPHLVTTVDPQLRSAIVAVANMRGISLSLAVEQMLRAGLRCMADAVADTERAPHADALVLHDNLGALS